MSLDFDVLTLFPSMFAGPLQESILARARRAGRVGVRLHDLRRWGVGRHRQVDDTPFGGGGGMILKPEPFFEAAEELRARYPAKRERIVLMSPQGRRAEHSVARRLAGFERIVLLCGRYEGVDERVRAELADEEISVGDVVLTGGELPAIALIDAVSRFVDGVLGRPGTAEQDSFAKGLLEYPYYTRPAEFRGLRVPQVLLDGDHGKIAEWRARRAREATAAKRPDLLDPDEGPTGGG